MDFPLTNVLRFREGESHAPNPKPALNFNHNGLQKDHSTYMSIERRIQNIEEDLGNFILLEMSYEIGQFIFSLGTFSLDVLSFSSDDSLLK